MCVRWVTWRGSREPVLPPPSASRRPHNLRAEVVEIEAALADERESRNGLAWQEAFFRRGNFIRYTGTSNSLLASGIHGMVKVVTTAIFVFFLADTLGRTLSLLLSSLGMGNLFIIIGALLKSFPTPANPSGDPPPRSKAMAAMLYIYVLMYSLGWGPIPYARLSCSDHDCTDASHELYRGFGTHIAFTKQTASTSLGYKLLPMFATIDIGGMAVFSSFIPETKGRSLEEMDVIFSSVQEDKRRAGIVAHEQALGVDGEETVT
ncbi:hypothetical protein NUW54_g5186 [Trametes sanguinea]|uniref:Uncharacterized protein n=1 Tax=Trametes sanguinea TaxID=158606 RepID=A0ACC1PYJ1_9APHY|nr:hypothetical protein NUW54_g5186 [Trametes sanguinea]